jgi:uncharacterized protein YcbK (DUF882 family)
VVLAAARLIAFAISLAVAGTPAPKRKPVRKLPRSVELVHINSHERLLLRFVDDQGRPIKGMDRRCSRFFRCHHTQKQSRMNPRLMRLLFAVGRHYPGKRLEVVSGYRHPSVAKNPRSPHMKGLACDFRVTGLKNTELRDYLRGAFKHVGVGYYPNSSFVHLDVRKGASAFWIDYSGPGESAMYSENAQEDLRSGRAQAAPAGAPAVVGAPPQPAAAGQETAAAPPPAPQTP